jgi:hypothetical protein
MVQTDFPKLVSIYVVMPTLMLINCFFALVQRPQSAFENIVTTGRFMLRNKRET